MRLTDLEPKWIDLGDRHGLGILWRCQTGHCQGHNATLFANPLDGGPPFDGDTWRLLDELLKVPGLIGYEDESNLRKLVRGCGMFRWQRTGDTFDTLSLTPSVNAHDCGHFFITAGDIR